MEPFSNERITHVEKEGGRYITLTFVRISHGSELSLRVGAGTRGLHLTQKLKGFPKSSNGAMG